LYTISREQPSRAEHPDQRSFVLPRFEWKLCSCPCVLERRLHPEPWGKSTPFVAVLKDNGVFVHKKCGEPIF